MPGPRYDLEDRLVDFAVRGKTSLCHELVSIFVVCPQDVEAARNECNELISILVASVRTATERM
jgi:hypothetical protein